MNFFVRFAELPISVPVATIGMEENAMLFKSLLTSGKILEVNCYTYVARNKFPTFIAMTVQQKIKVQVMGHSFLSEYFPIPSD